MPHLVTTSPDIKSMRETALRKARDVYQSPYDIASSSNGEVSRREGVEQFSISKIMKVLLVE